MAWKESSAWIQGDHNDPIYHGMLEDAATASDRNAGRKKIIKPSEMPWEMSRQGILKHLIHERLNTRLETVDAYMQIIPPGSRSGKHRHLSEECLYVLEGRGYDLHQDCDLELTDHYEWRPQDDIQRFDWEAGDVIYVPPNTIHQHFNADPHRPARLISSTNRLQVLRLERSGSDRRRAGIRRGTRADTWLRSRVAQRRPRIVRTSGRGTGIFRPI